MTAITIDPVLLEEIRRQTSKALVGLEQLADGVAQLSVEVRECRQVLADTAAAAEQYLPRQEPRQRLSVETMSPGRYWPNKWPYWMHSQPPCYLGRVALTPAGPVTTRLTHLG